MRDAAAVRRASGEDAAAVARLLHDFQEEFSEPTPGASVLAERYAPMLESGEVTVLLAGAGPDGFAQLRFRPSVLSGSLDSYLEELYVIPAKRGHGIGRALLEAAIEAARAAGAIHMEIGVDESDAAARNLYESVGFTNRESGGGRGVSFFYEREL